MFVSRSQRPPVFFFHTFRNRFFCPIGRILPYGHTSQWLRILTLIYLSNFNPLPLLYYGAICARQKQNAVLDYLLICCYNVYFWPLYFVYCCVFSVVLQWRTTTTDTTKTKCRISGRGRGFRGFRPCTLSTPERVIPHRANSFPRSPLPYFQRALQPLQTINYNAK